MKNSEQENSLVIYGRQVVLESIQSGRTIDRLLFIEQDHVEGSAKKILTLAKEKHIQIKFISRDRMNQLSDNGKHQGVLAYIAAHAYATLEEIFEKAEKKNEPPFILVLDGIEDPHNLGAIMRTAYSAGVHGIIIPKNRAVSLTATVAKTSAGAIEYISVCKVTNIVRTMKILKEKGLWITGSDVKGTSMYDVDFKGSIALVIGSEGKGMGQLVKEKCDFIASIPMKGEIGSLNASVAAGILMYEAVRQRG